MALVSETGCQLDKTVRSRNRTVRTIENIAAVAQSVQEQPSTSFSGNKRAFFDGNLA